MTNEIQSCFGRLGRLIFGWAFLVLLCASAWAQPVVVSGVTGKQRPNTTLVDITYNLSLAEAPTAIVTVKASRDGGVTFEAVPSETMQGAVGPEQTAGTGKTLVWAASQSWEAALYPTVQIEVTATIPPPAGFVSIPAGAFMMGDSFNEGSSYEQPTHSVTLSAFYMATHETTKAKWDDVRTWGLAHGYTDLYVGSGKAVDHPVQSVSWNDIVKWCNAASERDGLVPVYRTSTGEVHRTGTDAPTIAYGNNGYRLPSEAEWEKAARGGLSGKRFPWGDSITHEQANYESSTDYDYDVSPTRGYHPDYQSGLSPYTSPVGSFAANSYGLYDMAGNVREWCNDWHGSTYYAHSPSSDPRGPSSGTLRLLRGGSYGSNAYYCRVAVRSDAHYPSSRGNYVGFRLARSF